MGERVERLEQRIMELKQENAELGYSRRNVISNTMDLVGKVERGAEDNRARFDKVLGRPIPDRNLIDQLLEPKVTS